MARISPAVMITHAHVGTTVPFGTAACEPGGNHVARGIGSVYKVGKLQTKPSDADPAQRTGLLKHNKRRFQ